MQVEACLRGFDVNVLTEEQRAVLRDVEGHKRAVATMVCVPEHEWVHCEGYDANNPRQSGIKDHIEHLYILNGYLGALAWLQQRAPHVYKRLESFLDMLAFNKIWFIDADLYAPCVSCKRFAVETAAHPQNTTAPEDTHTNVCADCMIEEL